MEGRDKCMLLPHYSITVFAIQQHVCTCGKNNRDMYIYFGENTLFTYFQNLKATIKFKQVNQLNITTHGKEK